MSIRSRLVTLCLVISLLPAIPLSLLVKTLIDKSFDVGLSHTVEEALQSGLVISREHLNTLHMAFEDDVERLIGKLPDSGYDVTTIARIKGKDSASQVRGFYILSPSRDGQPLVSERDLPAALRSYAGDSQLAGVIGEAKELRVRTPVLARSGVTFLESQDRVDQFALWREVLFFSEVDSQFLQEAERLIEGRQIFAQLRLRRPTLARSFFLPFVIIYAVILILSIGLALVMSQRLSRPIRELAQGANVVAGGDWSYRLRVEAGGEVGRLVDAFNGMLARLDDQRRRLVDMERMATWREMARHLAHEIKNPLLPIRLTIQELKDQYRGDDTRYREILVESTRVVSDELNHLKKLVKEFSSFARMPDISPRPASLPALVSDVAKLYPQAEVDIDFDRDIGEFPFDPDQMRIVLINLFDNAVSAQEANGDIRIRISITRSGKNVVVEFTDNGPGIPGDNIDRVFDPYFTTREEGTGLGLAMVKNVILLHGGIIEARSSEGKGATFSIKLPLVGPPKSDSIDKER